MPLEFFNNILNVNVQRSEEKRASQQESTTTTTDEVKLFDIAKFEEELFLISSQNNQEQQQYSSSINAYDLMGCIRAALFKYFKIPVESFANKWLPILMRSSIGRAIHAFIEQNTTQFTETEVSIKVPSLHFSGIADAIINNNVLVEIKSCPYTDYKTIIDTKKPRLKDFYQTIIYKYFLENYCDEVREYCEKHKLTHGNPPKQTQYNFTKIQYIYVAHDIVSADSSSLSEALSTIRKIKRTLNSKDNKFFFMTTLVIDSRNETIKDALLYIIDRIKEFNKYIEANKIPPLDHKYVDKKECYFCIYNKVCSQY